MKNKKFGVIVGRFQVATPHAGHMHLILEAWNKCDQLYIFVGHRTVRSKSDPLSIYQRIQGITKAIQGRLDNVTILPLVDRNDDETWVDHLIETVDGMTSNSKNVSYFGSRDSFLSYLPEELNKEFIEPIYDISGKTIRNNIKDIDSHDFRSGYIKAVNDEFPSHAAVVDILVTNEDKILIGFKEKFMEHCTIGGFCDGDDLIMEKSAVRELEEETGLIAKEEDLTYLMSSICDSWMYGRHRAPFTVAYTVEYKESMGIPVPGDDIDELEWMTLDEALDSVGPDHHKRMIKKLINLRDE